MRIVNGWLIRFLLGSFLGTMMSSLEAAPAYQPNFTPTVRVVGPTETVFNYPTDRCGPQDHPDNPPRAFYDANHQINLVFGNSMVYYPTLTEASMGQPIQHLCNYPNHFSHYANADAKPSQFENRMWLINTWTDDGQTIYAMIHNEFHGEATSSFCSSGKKNLCQYWNVMAGISTDGGKTYQLLRDNQGIPQPVFVTPKQYVPNSGMQGYTAQTNIIKAGDYYYTLVNSANIHGKQRFLCLFRTATISDPTSWRGWDGQDFTVSVVNPYEQPINNSKPYTCAKIAPGMYRFSLTYNTVFHAYMALGIAPHWRLSNGQTSQAIVFALSEDLIHWSRPYLIKAIQWMDSWKASTVANPVTGVAYPTLLDPTSPGMNFEITGQNPYLYYTRFAPKSRQFGGAHRDLVREPLLVQKK